MGEPNFVYYSSTDNSSSIPPVICELQDKPADASTLSWNGFVKIVKTLGRFPLEVP